MASKLTPRDNRNDMYDLMTAIFRRPDASEARRVAMNVDAEPSEIQMWVNENLPYEYRNRGDLMRAYDRMSRADIFMGRVMRRQYYRFWAYANDMMTMGVSTARMTDEVNHERIRFPSYLMKMARSKAVRQNRKETVSVISEYTHTSTRRAASDVLPYLRLIMQNDPSSRVPIVCDMGLEPNQTAFILGVKNDSKEIKAIYKEVEDLLEERRLRSQATDTDAPAVFEEAPKASEPAHEETTQARPKGQKSLFDFRGRSYG
jgi:replication factor C large subunit